MALVGGAGEGRREGGWNLNLVPNFADDPILLMDRAKILGPRYTNSRLLKSQAWSKFLIFTVKQNGCHRLRLNEDELELTLLVHPLLVLNAALAESNFQSKRIKWDNSNGRPLSADTKLSLHKARTMQPVSAACEGQSWPRGFLQPLKSSNKQLHHSWPGGNVRWV